MIHLLEIEKRVLRLFNEHVSDIQLVANEVWAKRLVDKGLLRKVPDSNYRYALTEEGMRVWREIQK